MKGYMTVPESFGTDPTTLTREQLIEYVKQLKATIYRWQDTHARKAGFKNREYWYQQQIENK